MFELLNLQYKLSSTKDNKETLLKKIGILRDALGYDHMDYLYTFEDVIRRTGLFNIEKRDFSSFAGALYKIPNEKPLIVLNSKYKNLNFVLAHEVIHYFLIPEATNYTCTLSTDMKNQSSSDEYEEWRANFGAAEILVPKNCLKQDLLHESIIDNSLIKLLAQKYRVSNKVMEYRIKPLMSQR